MTTMSQRATLKRARLHNPNADRGDRVVGIGATLIVALLFVLVQTGVIA